MGVYLNGQKMGKPYLNGQKHNAYLNGQKVWKSGPPWDPEDIAIEVTVAAGDLSFTVPLCGSMMEIAAYNLTVNWGDGTASTHTGTSDMGTTGAPHTYAAPGTYTVVIKPAGGAYSYGWGLAFCFNAWMDTGPNAQDNRDKITGALNLPYKAFAASAASTGDGFLGCVFSGCTKLTHTVEAALPATVTTIKSYYGYYQYINCSSLTEPPDEPPLPPNLTSIGSTFRQEQYSDCTALTRAAAEAALPASLTAVGASFRNRQYNYCTALANVSTLAALPSGISSVGTDFRYAQYQNCTALSVGGIVLPYGFSGELSRSGAYKNFFACTNARAAADTLPQYYASPPNGSPMLITAAGQPIEDKNFLLNRTGITGYSSLHPYWK
jgi:hypothetical protein